MMAIFHFKQKYSNFIIFEYINIKRKYAATINKSPINKECEEHQVELYHCLHADRPYAQDY